MCVFHYLLSHFPPHYQKPHSYPQVLSLLYARQVSLNNRGSHKHLHGAPWMDPSLNALDHPATCRCQQPPCASISVRSCRSSAWGHQHVQTLAPCRIVTRRLPPLPGRHPTVGGSLWPCLVSSQISRNLGKLYSEMIFVNGFVHCDPHPGNVLVKKCPASGKAHIILLDHGLYQVCRCEGLPGPCEAAFGHQAERAHSAAALPL